MNKKITELRLEDLKMVAGGKIVEIVFNDNEGMVIVGSAPKPPKKPSGGGK